MPLFLMQSVVEQTKLIRHILPVASQQAVKAIERLHLHVHMVVNVTSNLLNIQRPWLEYTCIS